MWRSAGTQWRSGEFHLRSGSAREANGGDTTGAIQQELECAKSYEQEFLSAPQSSSKAAHE
jgi:hypothetical protein